MNVGDLEHLADFLGKLQEEEGDSGSGGGSSGQVRGAAWSAGVAAQRADSSQPRPASPPCSRVSPR